MGQGKSGLFEESACPRFPFLQKPGNLETIRPPFRTERGKDGAPSGWMAKGWARTRFQHQVPRLHIAIDRANRNVALGMTLRFHWRIPGETSIPTVVFFLAMIEKTA